MKLVELNNALVKKERPGKRIFTQIIKDIPSWGLLVPSLLALLIVIWSPIVQGFIYSFFKLKGYEPVAFIGFKNYKDVISDTLFLQVLFNTLAYVFWSLIIGFLPPIILAVMINEIVHMKSIIKFLLYLPVITPMVATSLVWYFLFQPGDGGVLNMIMGKVGLPNQVWLQNSNLTIPLIIFTMTWKSMGGTMLIFLACLQGINQEQYEAATLDGAGIFKKFTNITLPYLYPLALLGLVRQIMAVFQVMSEPLLMTDGGPNNASLSLNLTAYYYAYRSFHPEKALALGTVTFLMLLLLTLFYFKIKDKVEDF